MEIKEAEAKILKAVREAKKMLEVGGSVSGDGSGTGGIGANPVGKDAVGVETLKTATAETQPNNDQVPIARGKLRETEKTPPKKATKAIKTIPKSDKGEEPPPGYIDPKPGDPNWRVLVSKDAIKNPEQFVATKKIEDQGK